jgi:hypothetical protein
MAGSLSNENLQSALRAIDRRLQAKEAMDLEAVLKTSEGRRLYTRLVYEMCNLEGLSFNFDIKDGVCAGLHQAHQDGCRMVGRTLIHEAMQACPDLWARAVHERFARLQADQAEREEAINKSAGEQT